MTSSSKPNITVFRLSCAEEMSSTIGLRYHIVGLRYHIIGLRYHIALSFEYKRVVCYYKDIGKYYETCSCCFLCELFGVCNRST